jgi:hypothetical protein
MALETPLSEHLLALVDASRRTHESYATYLSVASVTDGLQTIADNPVYLDYWRSAAALAGALDPSGPVPAVLEYLFHLMMSPAALGSVRLRDDHRRLLTHAPDRRMTAIGELLADRSASDAITGIVAGSADVAAAQDALAEC